MADMQPIPNLELYVDVEDALKRVCGNKKIYKTLLGTFKKTLKYEQMKAEIAQGDFETAAQTAHSIKGVAANLSLKAVYEKVVMLETQLKGGSCDPKDLDELGEVLEITLQCTEYLESFL